MKKVIPLLLVLFVFAGIAQSQSFQFYRVSPPTVYGDTSAIMPAVTVAYFKNLSSANQNYKFIRVVNNLPDTTWSSSMCVQFCYSSEVSEIPPLGAPPITLPPNGQDSLLIDVIGPTPGLATIVIKCYVETNPGNFITDTFRVQLGTVGIRQISTVVDGYELGQNYPNPYNPVTKINFSVPKSERVSLKVYDILGNEVADLIPYKVSAPGSYSVEFDANSYKLSSGIYYYTLRAGNFVSTKKMILVK